MEDVRIGRPGHGDPVTDVAGLVTERFAMHERRAARILRLLQERGPLSAHELAQALWGGVAITQAFLTLSEVLGHLDLLLERGDAEEHKVDGTVRFSA
jgi:predicted ArsR family transcriptional regulator